MSINAIDSTRPMFKATVDSAAAPHPSTEHDKLVRQARVWVAQTFFGTLLKQMRESPFKSDLFSGGRGGQAFGGLYDQHLAEHMGRGAGDRLVRGIVSKIEGAARYQKAQNEKSAPNERTTIGIEH